MSGQNNNRRRTCANLILEMLEFRVVPTGGIGFDSASRVLSIIGSNGNDSAEVRQQGKNIIVSVNSGFNRLSRTMSSAAVSRIVFTGAAGNDSFTNLTAIPVRADGGSGNDVLRGGSAADEMIGGGGNDHLFGKEGNDTINAGAGNDMVDAGAGSDFVGGGLGDDSLMAGLGNDSLNAGEGDDFMDGGLGTDHLVGGDGLDHEIDAQDNFADGDINGDGYDNDYDYMDILYESPGTISAYADDASVAPTIALVTQRVREALRIPADATGLRVRVAKDQFGGLVSGVWRYMTSDKIQVWAKWCQPAGDPSGLQLFVDYSYTGPHGSSVADYSNPANYVVSQENRIYAGYLSGPVTFVNWLPGQAVGFAYWAPNEQATGFPAPIEQLKAALRSLPNFSSFGDSFYGNLSNNAGFKGVQPVLGLLRTINRVNQSWYRR